MLEREKQTQFIRRPETAEILPDGSDYWVRQSPGGIEVGLKNAKDSALELSGDIAEIIYSSMRAQKVVELNPVIHAHDEDLDTYDWGGKDLVRVRKLSRRFSDPQGAFDNPLVVERGTIYDKNCHVTARDVARELYYAAAEKKPTNTSELTDYLRGTFPIVVKVYERNGEYDVDRHSFVVLGRATSGEYLCFEKIGGGLPFRVANLDTILSQWKDILGAEKILVTAASKVKEMHSSDMDPVAK